MFLLFARARYSRYNWDFVSLVSFVSREREKKKERECVLLVRKYIIINIIFYYCCCWCRDTIPFFKFFFFFLCFFFVDSFHVIYDFYSRIYIEYWWFSSLRPFLLITFFFFFYFSFLLRVGLCAHSCWYFIYLIRIEDRNQFFFIISCTIFGRHYF